jgi:uncharacterized membrane protein
MNALVLRKSSAASAVKPGTIIGAGVGGLLGLVFLGPIGLAVGVLAGGAAGSKVSKPTDYGVLTPARDAVFGAAMDTLRDPTQFRMLADAFERKGLGEQAERLRKRAALREESAEVKERRREAFKRAMSSDNIEAVEEIARMFERREATKAAAKLRGHARALRALRAAGRKLGPAAVPAVAAGDTASADAPGDAVEPVTSVASSIEDQEHFADALCKAVVAFGANSEPAFTAAKNLIESRGGTPTGEAVTAAISAALDTVRDRAVARRSSDAHLDVELPTEAEVVSTPEGHAAAEAAQRAQS